MKRTIQSLLLVLIPSMTFAAPAVTAIRCPNGGIQPQVAVDSAGKAHLIYLTGEDGKNNVMYVTSADDGKTWSKPLRVNSQPGAAIATGTVRGAHLALGKGGRAHVAWMGSSIAQPRGPRDSTPMLYARLGDAGETFEPQRNLITSATGLDGGGSVAADDAGNVYVGWHAPTPGMKGEENRTVWLAASGDDGKTFVAETRMLSQSTGACGCCGMRLGIDSRGNLLTLYRAANQETRDIYLAEPSKGGYSPSKLETVAIKTCPMSTMSFARGGERMLAAWEGMGQVSLASIDSKTLRAGEPIAPPGRGNTRKHPTLAINKNGDALFAWSEGTGWKKGGSVAWQVYDSSLKPVEGASGRKNDLAVWSLPAAFAGSDGSFVIVY